MKLIITSVLICIVYCLSNINSIAADTWRNIIDNNLNEYFNYKWDKDKIFRSGDVYIDSSCRTDSKSIELISPIYNNEIFPVCLKFNLKSVKEVLLLSAGCKYDPSFIAYYKLDPIKNINYLATRLKTNCTRNAYSFFLFVRTVDNKIYGDSQLFLSNYYSAYTPLKPIIPAEDLAVALNPFSLTVYENLKKYLNYNDTEISKLDVVSSGPCTSYKYVPDKIKSDYPKHGDISNSFCSEFNLKSVKEVLIFHIGCKKEPMYISYHKLDPKKNINYVPAEKKTNCREGDNITLKYLKTKNNKFYSDWSGYFVTD